MTNDPTTALGERRFVSLTTFKRNGDGVASVGKRLLLRLSKGVR